MELTIYNLINQTIIIYYIVYNKVIYYSFFEIINLTIFIANLNGFLDLFL